MPADKQKTYSGFNDSLRGTGDNRLTSAVHCGNR